MPLSEEEGAGAPLAAEVVRFVQETLNLGTAVDTCLPEELRGVEGMQQLHATLWGIRRLAWALSRGELRFSTDQRGFVVGALKALQADLRHLTWQAQRIADGEYGHRVHFLGDFSTAFNRMAEQLEKNVRELRERSSRYKELSCRDALTGLLNRRAFMELATRMLEEGRPGVCIMVDIDFFKKINDTYGHSCGDATLRAFARRLRDGLRPGDLCCRYGGEEFLIFLAGATSPDVGRSVAERLRRAVEQLQIPCDGHDLRVTASFGVSGIGEPAEDNDIGRLLEDAVRRADVCLYAAKSAGRNCVEAETGSEPPQAAPRPDAAGTAE
ncbi:MAG: GGDEF domain-containing protein [Desulfovibrionaceae bacterium]|nr:GGDEF domain-containing protein [Desulfovibrionaceae bacterium]